MRKGNRKRKGDEADKLVGKESKKRKESAADTSRRLALERRNEKAGT